MLEKIRILLNQYARDDVLEVLIDMCKTDAVAYCNLPEYTEDLDSTVIKMVIERYNKMGFEGLSSQGDSGVSNAFVDGYSREIYQSLIKFRKVRVVK
jgi:hypothetical protein